MPYGSERENVRLTGNAWPVLAVIAQTTPLAPVVIERGGTSPLVPIAGAIVGAVVAAGIAFVLRWLDVGIEVRRVDAAVREQDQAFADFIADLAARTEPKVQDARKAGDDLNVAVTDVPGVAQKYDQKIIGWHADALQEYRDELRAVRARVDAIRSVEQTQHRWYRKRHGLPEPTLDTPAYAEPLLVYWRRPSSLGGMPMAVEDATRRTLTTTMQSLRLI